MFEVLKRLLVGRPLATTQMEEQRISKTIALAVYSSDALSSTAYATEEILFVTALGASSLALGLSKLVPIAIVVAVLLAIVITSYRQVIFAYPDGGGAYVVSRENLGETRVARRRRVADGRLRAHRRGVDLGRCRRDHLDSPVRGSRGAPRRSRAGADRPHHAGQHPRRQGSRDHVRGSHLHLHDPPVRRCSSTASTARTSATSRRCPSTRTAFEGAHQFGGSLSLFLLAKGFSSGAVALTGVEAISNGVPSFRRPEAKNAATTLVWMGALLGSLFFGVSLLANRLQPYPSHDRTVLSQLGLAVYGEGLLFVLLQFATAAILVLAANTAYNGFPSLTSIVARDGYLPRQLAHRGDRLVFSNGIFVLAGAAGLLLIAFGGVTNALIPLYAVGVFTSFTLCQFGMVRHHRRVRERGWQRNVVLNATGGARDPLRAADRRGDEVHATARGFRCS